METPMIGSVWKHTVYDKTITIVDPSLGINSTRKIVWKYNKTGVIGGCNSCEWFYDDWKPCHDSNIQKNNSIEMGSYWLEKENAGDVVEIINSPEYEVVYKYKTGGFENKIFKTIKNEFIEKFTIMAN